MGGGRRGCACRNYVKFLISRDGRPVKRFGPSFDPLRAEADVRLLLAGRDVTPEECVLHPGRKVCNADRILAGAGAGGGGASDGGDTGGT